MCRSRDDVTTLTSQSAKTLGTSPGSDCDDASEPIASSALPWVSGRLTCFPIPTDCQDPMYSLLVRPATELPKTTGLAGMHTTDPSKRASQSTYPPLSTAKSGFLSGSSLGLLSAVQLHAHPDVSDPSDLRRVQPHDATCRAHLYWPQAVSTQAPPDYLSMSLRPACATRDSSVSSGGRGGRL